MRTSELAAHKLDDATRQIAELESMRAGLTRLVQSCDRAAGAHGCPIIDELNDTTAALP
ncbi:MAG: hypothetical protein WAK18_16220 [Nocardioidaceae bacterium]